MDLIEQLVINTKEPTAVNVVLDDELATELLSRNARNRPLRPRRAERYRADMLNGMWAENGETLKLDTMGRLADGQHRCWAVKGTDLSIPMLAVFGLPPDATATIDQGAPRNAGDYLQMRGEEHGRMVARVA